MIDSAPPPKKKICSDRFRFYESIQSSIPMSLHSPSNQSLYGGISGVGAAMVVMSIIVAIYYNVIMAYTLFFTFASFQGGAAPWTECQGTVIFPQSLPPSHGSIPITCRLYSVVSSTFLSRLRPAASRLLSVM